MKEQLQFKIQMTDGDGSIDIIPYSNPTEYRASMIEVTINNNNSNVHGHQNFTKLEHPACWISVLHAG